MILDCLCVNQLIAAVQAAQLLISPASQAGTVAVLQNLTGQVPSSLTEQKKRGALEWLIFQPAYVQLGKEKVEADEWEVEPPPDSPFAFCFGVSLRLESPVYKLCFD